MGSIAVDQGLPQLTALERIGPKGYLRYIFPFQLENDYDITEVTRVLQAGYDALCAKLPEVACEAVPDTESKQAGVLKYAKRDDGEKAFITKDLRDSYVSTYAELKERHFPVSSFDADTFCCRDIWPQPGERLPIAQVQANFIRGGLILNWSILHLAGDGTSFCVWTKIWAEGCRRAQGDHTSPVDLPEAIWKDREQVMKPSGRNQGRLEDHPEFTLLPFTPPGMPPKMTSTNHRGQIYYFSPESLAALKADASPANATQPTDQKWISTNDALSALLWRTVMAVQHPIEELQGEPVSVFNIALDGRQRTSPRVHPSTLGCFLEWFAPSVSIREMLSSLNIADLAVLIRKTLNRVDDHFTDDLVTLVDSINDIDRLVATAFLDVPGKNCCQSSWLGFELYGIEWGPILGNKIEAVRLPHVGVINGAQLVLPQLPNGGMEVLVGVESNCLDKLLNDPLFNKYGVAW
ncbi:Transferase [Penicillium frequentans]|nr:Transferase [Penicillium glabrum]